MRKCCERGQYLNLRAVLCVDDGTREWKNPPVFATSADGGELVEYKEAGNYILLEDMIRYIKDNLLNTAMLTVDGVDSLLCLQFAFSTSS